MATAAATKGAPAPSKKPGIGQFIEGLILSGKENDKILEQVQGKFPGAKTTNSSVNWYRTKLRGAGEDVGSSRAPKEPAKAAKAAPAAPKGKSGKPTVVAVSKPKTSEKPFPKKAVKKAAQDDEDGGFED